MQVKHANPERLKQLIYIQVYSMLLYDTLIIYIYFIIIFLCKLCCVYCMDPMIVSIIINYILNYNYTGGVLIDHLLH